MPIYTTTPIPYDPEILPSGFDRADGEDGRLGTATPAGAIEIDTGGDYSEGTAQVEEMPDSPTIERAEQATITHTWRINDWQVAKDTIEFYGRGRIWTDSDGRLTKVLSSTLQHEKGGTAILTVVSEGISFDSPPDHFSCIPIELGINIIKHPRYFYSFFGANGTEEVTNQMVIRMLQNYFDNPSAAYRDALTQQLKASEDWVGTSADPNPYGAVNEAGLFVWNDDTVLIPGTKLAKRAAEEIVQKYWRNSETPYLIGREIRYAQYFWLPQPLNPGGYIEDPITEGGLPDYFWETEFGTIFSSDADFNPQCYSDTGDPGGTTNISWLRKADEVEFERTWFRITKTWMGSAVGFWDPELYSSSHRPHVPSDYLTINASAAPQP